MKEFRRTSHSVYLCDYHLVWPTKYRRKILNEGVLAYLKEVVKGLGKHYPEVMIKEINTDEDHMHLLVSIPPQMSVGKVVGIIKANTARALKRGQRTLAHSEQLCRAACPSPGCAEINGQNCLFSYEK